MVLWVPANKGIYRVQHNGGDVGSATPGTSVTTGGSSSTKGTPAELIASTSFDTYRIVIIASGYGTSAISSMGCLDILIGGATEEVLIPNLLMGFCGSFGTRDRGPKIWEFPLYIPAGSRLAAQAAGERVSTAFNVVVYLYGGNAIPPGPLGGKVTTYGITTIPEGTNIDPGANGAEGVWSQMTASTNQDHIALIPSFQSNLDITLQQVVFQVDVGVGSATEESLGSYWYTSDIVETLGGPYPYTPIYQNIPAGTRLVMRSSSSGVSGNFNGVIHAVS